MEIWHIGEVHKSRSLEMVACCIFDNSTTASSALSLWMPCYMCVPDTALGDLSTFTSFDEWSASKGVCQHVGVTPWASYALVSQLVGNGSFPKEGPPPCLQSFPPQGPPAESLVPNTDEWTITLLLALSEEKSADVFMVHSLLSRLLICDSDDMWARCVLVCLVLPRQTGGCAVTTS